MFKRNNLILDQATIQGTGFLYIKSSSKPTVINDNSFISNLVILNNDMIIASTSSENSCNQNEDFTNIFNTPSYISDYQLISANFDSKLEKKQNKNTKKIVFKKNKLKKANNVQIVIQYASDYQICPLFAWHFNPFFMGNIKQKIRFQCPNYLNINLKPLLNPPLV